MRRSCSSIQKKRAWCESALSNGRTGGTFDSLLSDGAFREVWWISFYAHGASKTFQGRVLCAAALHTHPQRLRPHGSGIVFCCCSVAKSCSALCNPIDCSPPSSSVYGILQARVLEQVAISFSRDLPNLGIKPGSPALQVDFFYRLSYEGVHNIY